MVVADVKCSKACGYVLMCVPRCFLETVRMFAESHVTSNEEYLTETDKI